MIMQLRFASLRKMLPITIVGFIFGGLCLAVLVSHLREGKSDASNLSLCVVGILFLCAAVFFIVGSLSGLFQKTLRQYCEQSDNLTKVEQFYRSTPPVYGVRISREYILAAGIKTNFLMASDLLWVYAQVSVLPPYFKKEIYINFMPKDGRQEQYKVKNEKQAEAILEYVQKTLPWILIGNSEQLQGIYKSDRESMVRIVEERRAGRRVEVR